MSPPKPSEAGYGARYGARYGLSADGRPIAAPTGWRLLCEGQEIPSVHREADESGRWLAPRRCRSTMTPIVASVSGYRRAFAVPDDDVSGVQVSSTVCGP